MTKRVVGIGAGGHSKVILDILQHDPDYNVVGLTEANRELWGQSLCGAPVLGDDKYLLRLWENGVRYAFLGIGSTRSTSRRAELFHMARRTGFEMIRIVHPKAIVALSTRWGTGDAVMAGAVINPEVELGNNVLVNTGAIVEHECRLGDHSHIASGAKLAGGVEVGIETHVGIGAVVIQGVQLGDGVTVGAGAVVLRDVSDGATVVGVPARRVAK